MDVHLAGNLSVWTGFSALNDESNIDTYIIVHPLLYLSTLRTRILIHKNLTYIHILLIPIGISYTYIILIPIYYVIPILYLFLYYISFSCLSCCRFQHVYLQWNFSYGQISWWDPQCQLWGWKVEQTLLWLWRRQHLDADVYSPFLRVSPLK